MLAAKYFHSPSTCATRTPHGNCSLQPDIRVGRSGRVGRAHLKVWADAMLREQFTGFYVAPSRGPHHQIHPTASTRPWRGVLQEQNHETSSKVGPPCECCARTEYERIGGRWYFRRRLPCYWYATDLNRPPLGELKMRWPGREPYAGTWHDLWPSWKQFWASPPAHAPQVAAPAPLGQFLRQLRRGAPDPRIRVR